MFLFSLVKRWGGRLKLRLWRRERKFLFYKIKRCLPRVDVVLRNIFKKSPPLLCFQVRSNRRRNYQLCEDLTEVIGFRRHKNESSKCDRFSFLRRSPLRVRRLILDNLHAPLKLRDGCSFGQHTILAQIWTNFSQISSIRILVSLSAKLRNGSRISPVLV